jgi:hypothetical protein
MANEVTFSVSLKASKNNATVNQTANLFADMTGGNMTQVTQTIGTAAELVDFGDISGAPQLVMIRNLSTTRTVEIGGDAGLTIFKTKILPGQASLFSPTSGTLYAIALVASASIMIVAVEA